MAEEFEGIRCAEVQGLIIVTPPSLDGNIEDLREKNFSRPLIVEAGKGIHSKTSSRAARSQSGMLVNGLGWDFSHKIIPHVLINVLVRSNEVLSTQVLLEKMLPEANQHDTLSNSDIVRYCNHSNRQVVSGALHGNLVVKLSEDVVVKFGHGVSAEEATNQRIAFDLLDSSIVRVAKLYRFFTWTENNTLPPKGFIVMEYIHGEVLESVNAHQIEQIVQVLSYFSTIRRQRPGPLQAGVSRGLLWEESGKPTFQTVRQMERWLNFRLPDIEAKLALEGLPLVLCHLDLALRNIIWLEDGSLCLLDWASAGFYPRFFEVCLLKVMEYSHGNYELMLMDRMEKLTEAEEAQMTLLARSFYNGIKYSFVSSPFV